MRRPQPHFPSSDASCPPDWHASCWCRPPASSTPSAWSSSPSSFAAPAGWSPAAPDSHRHRSRRPGPAPAFRADRLLDRFAHRHDALARQIRAVRRASRNPAIGVMIGGPLLIAHPGLAARGRCRRHCDRCQRSRAAGPAPAEPTALSQQQEAARSARRRHLPGPWGGPYGGCNRCERLQIPNQLAGTL